MQFFRQFQRYNMVMSQLTVVKEISCSTETIVSTLQYGDVAIQRQIERGPVVVVYRVGGRLKTTDEKIRNFII